jgi:predicted DNA-binding protein with PD1-like motif
MMRIVAAMQARVLDAADPVDWILVFDEGEEVISALTGFARDRGLRAGHFQAIGGFFEATLGYFEWTTRNYLHIPVREQVEVVSMLGDIAMGRDGQVVHAHAVLGRRDGSALAGHLLAGRIRPTLELILNSTPAALARTYDERSGLALINVRSQ